MQLLQDDGTRFWVDLLEAGRNAHCLLLAQAPQALAALFPPQMLRRADTGQAARTAALLVDSPEPSRVLLSLTLGPQVPLQEKQPLPHKVQRVRGACLNEGRA